MRLENKWPTTFVADDSNAFLDGLPRPEGVLSFSEKGIELMRHPSGISERAKQSGIILC